MPVTIDRAEEFRARMVEEQIASRGVRDARVLDGTRAVRPLVTDEVAGLPETYPFGL